MGSDIRGVLLGVWLVLALFHAAPAMSAGTTPQANALIGYSHDPATVLISFREVFPEFADQDPTPLVRIYGDGRVVVFHPSYMKQAGHYEMLLSRSELEILLLQLTPALIGFDAAEVKRQKQAADDLLWASASELEQLTLFHDADAEVSIFHLNIISYQPNGPQGPVISQPVPDRSWHGLRFDARDYPGLEAIQALMQAETTLRTLTTRSELVLVNSPP
jgi:hypothetical protein